MQVLRAAAPHRPGVSTEAAWDLGNQPGTGPPQGQARTQMHYTQVQVTKAHSKRSQRCTSCLGQHASVRSRHMPLPAHSSVTACTPAHAQPEPPTQSTSGDRKGPACRQAHARHAGSNTVASQLNSNRHLLHCTLSSQEVHSQCRFNTNRPPARTPTKGESGATASQPLGAFPCATKEAKRPQKSAATAAAALATR